MSVESIDLEGMPPSGIETDVEESLSLDWNGRSVSEVQPNQRIEGIREIVFLNHIAAKGFVQTTYIPLAGQNLVFPCVSILIFNPICIAPISWIGDCFDRVKSQALTLGNSQVLTRERYTFSFIEQGDFSGNRRSDFILCGASVDGEVSVSGSVDTEGNKSAEVEIEVSSKDGTVSGSVSGSMSQDGSGHTEGKVEGEVIIRF